MQKNWDYKDLLCHLFVRVCLVRSSSRQNIEYVQRLTKNTASVPGFCFNGEDVFPRDHGNKYFNVVSFVECEWNLQTLITTHTKGWYHQCKKMLRLVPVNITIIKLNPQTSEENSEDFFLNVNCIFVRAWSWVVWGKMALTSVYQRPINFTTDLQNFCSLVK